MSTVKKVVSKATEHVVLPQLGRMGNLVTGGLIGLGINAQHADWVSTGLVGAVLIGLDLIASAFGRWMQERKLNGSQNQDGNRVQVERWFKPK